MKNRVLEMDIPETGKCNLEKEESIKWNESTIDNEKEIEIVSLFYSI